MFANQLGRHRGFKKFISILVTMAMSITFTFSSLFFPGISSNNFANAKTAKNINNDKKPADHILSKEESKKSKQPTTSYVPGDLLVKLETGKGVDYAKKLAKKNNDEFVSSISKLGVFRIKTKDNVKDKAKNYKNDAGVKFVEPNYIATASYIPNDPLLNQQWAINKMQATAAWDIERGQSNPVTIAVIDTGVDKDHPDLNDKVVPGYDFINDDNNPDDDHGHGTHVAGIAAAETDNNEGIAGVSWHANIMPVKVLNSFGWGTYEGISEGIIYAADNGAKIINLSLGGSSTSATLESAVNYAHNKGSIVIASAGNSGSSNYNYPASFEKAVSVAATDQNDNRAGFSTYNNLVDIAAPGVNITSSFALSDGAAALAVSADAYSAVYLGFGFEAISTAPDRDATMNNVLQYLDVPTSDAILLVDDDLGESYETYYSQALANLGYGSVSSHEVMTSGPSLEQMTGKTVIWFTGWDYFDTLNEEDQSNLSQFLDNGGKLFLSGQDIGYHLTNGGFIYNAFFENYLKAKFVEDYSGSWDIKGVAGTPFEGMNFQIQGGDGADNQGYPEVIEPASEEAFTIFEYIATGEKYIPLSGTSMAAPQVSGLAALILSKNPSLTPLQVEEILKLNAQDTNNGTYPGKDNYLGWGRINALEGVKNENQKPYIDIINPLYGQSVTGSININVFTDDSVSGNANISEVIYSVDGAAPSPMNPTDGAFDSPSEDATATLDASILSVGQHEIEVNAKDSDGHWGDAIKVTVNFIDIKGPVTKIWFPWDGGEYKGEASSRAILARISDEQTGKSNIVDAVYSIDGAEEYAITPGDGKLDSPVESVFESLKFADLNSGFHSVSVRGKDSSGNWGPYSRVDFKVIDVEPPIAFIEGIYENNSQLVIDAIIDDSHDYKSNTSNIIEAAYVIDDGMPIFVNQTNGSFDSVIEQITYNIDKTSLTKDYHTINILGKDSSGNWSAITSTTFYNFYVASLPPSILWTKQFGTNRNDAGQEIAKDSLGNIYVTGTTNGNLESNINIGKKDIFLTKFSADGSKQWSKQIGTELEDESLSITVDSSDNVLISGYTYGNFENNINSGNKDALVVKFDNDGNKIWSKSLGSTLNDIATSLSADNSGNVYIAGYSWGNLGSYSNAGFSDLFIAKLDPNGEVKWLRQLGTNGNDEAYGIEFDNDENIYVIGNTNGKFVGQPQKGSYDIFIAKYDSDGAQQWIKQTGSSDYDFASGIKLDKSGKFYVTGYTNGNLYQNQNIGYEDAFLMKFDTNGTNLWTRTIATKKQDIAVDVGSDESSNAYVTGYTKGDLDKNVNLGEYDVFFVKYDEDGNKQYLKQFGTSESDLSYGIVNFGSSDIYLSGATWGDLEGDGNSGFSDVFLVKYGFDEVTPDSFVLNTPADEAVFTKPYPYFSWNYSNDSYSGVAKYQLYIDGHLERDNIVNWNAAVSAKPLTNGTHSWFVRAFDNAGNYTDTATRYLIIDKKPGKIAFLSAKNDTEGTTNGIPDIYLINDDGSGITNLTKSDNEIEESPVLSSSGDKIIFTRKVPTYSDPDNFDIFTIDIDGNNFHRLTTDAKVLPSGLGLAPDESKIVFTSYRDGNSEIYIMDSDGLNQQRLTYNSWEDYEPKFSPDGSKIIHISKTNSVPGSSTELISMNPDGTDSKEIFKKFYTNKSNPSFSPNGLKVIFNWYDLYRKDGKFYDTDFSSVVNLNGIYELGIAESGQSSFSIDGDKIICISDRDSDHQLTHIGYGHYINQTTDDDEIYVIDSRKVATRLTNDEFRDRSPSSGPSLISSPSDSTEPSLIINSPGENQIVGGSINLEAVVNDLASGNSKIYDAFYSVDGGPFIKMDATDGKFDSSIETVTATFDTSKLNAGSRTVTIKSRDDYGNWTSRSISINVLDIRGSEIIIKQPSKNQLVAGTINVEAFIDDTQNQSSNILEAIISVDGLSSTLMNPADGTFDSPTEDATIQYDSSALSIGSHLLEVTAKDSGGNWSSASIYIVILDTIAPSVTLQNPTVYESVSGIISVQAQLDDSLKGNSNITEVVYEIDGNLSNPMSPVDSAFNSPSEEASVQLDTTILKKGSHSLTIKCKDASGNWGSVSTPINVLDVTSPQVIVISPNEKQISKGIIKVSAYIHDITSQQSNIAEAEYKIDNNLLNVLNADDGIFDEPVEDVSAKLKTVNITNGIHTMQIRARDEAGNWSDWSAANINVDNPTVKIIFPQTSDEYYSGNIIIKGSVKFSNKLNYSKYILQYQKIEESDGTLINNPNWVYINKSIDMVDNATLGKLISKKLNGKFKVRLSAYDIDGNITTDVVTIRIDNVKPNVTPMFPLRSSVVGSLETINAKVSDYSGIKDTQLLLNDMLVESEFNSQTGILSYIPLEEEKLIGINKVTVIATDSAGNKNFYSYSFVYEPYGPVADIVSPEATLVGAKLTPIIGTVSSYSLKGWTLEYKKSTATSYKILSSGTKSSYGNRIIGYLPSLPNGVYDIRLSATNNGMVTNTDKISVTVSNSYSYDNLANIDEVFLTGNKIIIIGSASSSNLSSYKLFLKQVSPIVGTESLIYTGLSPVINNVIANKSIRGNGKYQLILKAYNSLGSEIGSDIYNELLNIDTTLPKITSMYPIVNDYYDTSLPITINAIDPEPFKGQTTKSGLSDSAIILIDGLPQEVALQSSSYSTTPESMIDGLHNMTVIVSDKAGNKLYKNFAFIYDSTKPIINITNFSTGMNIKGKYTIKGQVFDENISYFQIQYMKVWPPKTWPPPEGYWKTLSTTRENIYIDSDIRLKNLDDMQDSTIFELISNKLPGNGSYYFRFIVKDKAGNFSYYPEKSEYSEDDVIYVTIDNNPPGFEFYNSQDNSYSVNILPFENSYLKSTPSIQAYIDDFYMQSIFGIFGTGVDKDSVKLFINDEQHAINYIENNWYYNGCIYDSDKPLKDGYYNIKMFASDMVGNTSKVEGNYTIDQTNPIANLSIARSSIKLGNKLTIAGRASDKNIASWTLYQKQLYDYEYKRLASGFGNVGDKVYNSTLFTWAPTKTGSYNIMLEVKDKAGNLSSIAENVIVDNVSGYQNKAEITYPENNQIVKGIIPIVGTASTSSSFSYYTISRKNSTSSTETLLYKGIVPVEGGKLATFDTTKLNGTYDIILRRYIKSTVITEFGLPVRIKKLEIDNLSPAITGLKSIANQAGRFGHVKTNSPIFEINANELGSGIDELRSIITIDGIPLTLVFNSDGNAIFNNNLNTLYVTVPFLNNGTHKLVAMVYDKAGNKSKTSTYSFTVDTDDINAPTLPTSEITSPTESATVKGTIPIVGSAFDQNIYNYTLSYRKLGSDSYTTFYTSTTNVLDATLGSFKSTAVTDGQYDIKLTVNDKALNVPKESIITVFVDNTL